MKLVFGAHRLQVEASVPQSVGVFSLDENFQGEEKCTGLLPPWCDVAPGEAKSSLSVREGERERNCN